MTPFSQKGNILIICNNFSKILQQFWKTFYDQQITSNFPRKRIFAFIANYLNTTGSIL
jgi:hypothetical protein